MAINKSRYKLVILCKITSGSLPDSSKSRRIVCTASLLEAAIAFNKRSNSVSGTTPATDQIHSGVIVVESRLSLSRRPSASRRQPLDNCAVICNASSVMSIASFLAMIFRCCTIVSVPMRLKSKRWQREIIVAGTLCASVVQRTNTTFSGGSSKVLSRAWNAWELRL